jgi:hypothetical protein
MAAVDGTLNHDAHSMTRIPSSAPIYFSVFSVGGHEINSPSKGDAQCIALAMPAQKGPNPRESSQGCPDSRGRRLPDRAFIPRINLRVGQHTRPTV